MRDEVQRWLSACIVAGYDTPDGDNSHARFEVDATYLYALCRRWLAVEDAAVCEVAQKYYPAVMGYIGIEVSRELLGQRVRIVPEQGEGERG